MGVLHNSNTPNPKQTAPPSSASTTASQRSATLTATATKTDSLAAAATRYRQETQQLNRQAEEESSCTSCFSWLGRGKYTRIE